MHRLPNDLMGQASSSLTHHLKQSKFVQTLLPYAPWATELSKDAANEALQHIKSKDAVPSSDIASDAKENRSGADGSTNNPFY